MQKIIFLSILFFCHTAKATIIECNDIRELTKYSNEETLIVLGIHDVLMRTPQELGSNRWAEFEINEKANLLCINKQKAKDLFMPLWNKVLIASTFIPVEQNTVGIIRKIQRSNVIGLSSFGVEMAYPTHRKLRSIFIHLERNRIYEEDVEVTAEFIAKYVEGILFVGHKNDKGTALFSFLDLIQYIPNRIVFIDSGIINLRQVEASASERGIPFIGLYYTYVSKNLPPFDINVPRKQLELLERALSNEEAQKLLDSIR